MILHKNGVTYDLTDKTQIGAFLGSGWTESGAPYVKPIKPYSEMTDEELTAIATERGIDMESIKTRAALIKALEKAGQ